MYLKNKFSLLPVYTTLSTVNLRYTHIEKLFHNIQDALFDWWKKFKSLVMTFEMRKKNSANNPPTPSACRRRIAYINHDAYALIKNAPLERHLGWVEKKKKIAHVSLIHIMNLSPVWESPAVGLARAYLPERQRRHAGVSNSSYSDSQSVVRRSRVSMIGQIDPNLIRVIYCTWGEKTRHLFNGAIRSRQRDTCVLTREIHVFADNGVDIHREIYESILRYFFDILHVHIYM